MKMKKYIYIYMIIIRSVHIYNDSVFFSATTANLEYTCTEWTLYLLVILNFIQNKKSHL